MVYRTQCQWMDPLLPGSEKKLCKDYNWFLNLFVVHLCIMHSVWPNWAKFRHFGTLLKHWPFWKHLFSICINFELNLAILHVIGQTFIVLKGKIINKHSSRLVTLHVLYVCLEDIFLYFKMSWIHPYWTRQHRIFRMNKPSTSF